MLYLEQCYIDTSTFPTTEAAYKHIGQTAFSRANRLLQENKIAGWKTLHPLRQQELIISTINACTSKSLLSPPSTPAPSLAYTSIISQIIGCPEELL